MKAIKETFQFLIEDPGISALIMAMLMGWLIFLYFSGDEWIADLKKKFKQKRNCFKD